MNSRQRPRLMAAAPKTMTIQGNPKGTQYILNRTMTMEIRYHHVSHRGIHLRYRHLKDLRKLTAMIPLHHEEAPGTLCQQW